ncbi:MAG: SMC-Scp complex subunit ScpB [Candidatus Pacebacteria bacterium]|jgi:segregation and condensation protein B|nr:SMC-Scp complex subunit ScpB [Candidatus Paceibacterota bacterium]
MMTLDQKIEGLLFFKGEPLSVATIGSILNVKKEEVEKALTSLAAKLSDRGLTLMWIGAMVQLATKPELGPLFEALRKEELSKELSKASLETLAIIIYKGKATRSDIDYIRGVNSGFILRNLLVRGLIQKDTDPEDSRKYVYAPTFDLLSYLGVARTEELPEFTALSTALVSLQETSEEEKNMSADISEEVQ